MDTTYSKSRKVKRMFANILSIVVILALAFPVTGSAFAEDALPPKVGLVLNAFATGDNDFNWMAQQGLLQAETELGVSTMEYQPSNQSEYYALLQQCAEENDLCIAVGFDYGVALANTARFYTDTEWAIVDYAYPDCWEGATEGVDCGSFDELPNVRGLRFNEKQAGYLAGVLAGGMTASNTVGAVGGMEIPPVVAFVEGYRNGAQCTNPTVRVLSTYTGTFIDPSLGASTAQNMIGQGADVIFGAAGLTGNGAILHSALNGQWAIGVDTDQYVTVFGNGTVTGSDKILSSAMKRVDNAVYQTIEDYVNGGFTSGTVVYDLATNGVGLAPFHETDDSIPQMVKDNLEAVRQGIIDGSINVDVPCPWRDEFDGETLDPSWSWLNGDSGQWNLGDVPGFLRMYASNTGTPDGNLLLRGAANGDFMIKTHMIFQPNTNFQIAGLVIWQDEDNFLQFGRAFCNVEGACVGNGLYFDKALGGAAVDGNFGTQVNSPNEIYLRLERRGEMVKAFYSYDGFTWYEMGTHWIPSDFQVNAVGLTASQDFSEMSISADFGFFELTEGWGFLPEGFHDYDSGDVPAWACNAGGWAADPDDRAADVNIEVVVDHQTAANLVAGEFRQDLLDAGVCVDGNCSFSTSLWNVISSYEPHRVDIWAQDDTGDWVLLSNSAKTLTCRSYDIYAFDPLTGVTKQITGLEATYLRETGEYDPTWSPNGKLVAHDVVTSDSHPIYITDVKTGVSTLLRGTEDGGNDAAWSPNGKWIAFDRRWFDNDQNIYIVPATGGERVLVVENAFTASWAPSGKRIAFQSPDGSIRTAPVDGGKGGETLIAEFGGLPAWSPDGNWIAYSKDGDIWKVQVNALGVRKGEPIQLTSGPFQDGKPTWSPDSQTITYDSGFGQDSDLWSIPAAGGTPTWLTGAPVFGDYGPANARNSATVAYASFSPEGQAPRTWISAYTYNAGTWDAGTHTYQFWANGAPGSTELSFFVSEAAPLYDGFALIRPGNILRAQTSEGCVNVDAIDPAQETQFHAGWPFDGLYADAQVFYANLNAQVRWDSWEPVDMQGHLIFPFTSQVDWFGYTCTFTAP